MIAGINKIVPDLSAAVERVKRIACPANAIRHGWDTYCASKGRCMVPDCADDNLMAIPAGACPNSLCSCAAVFSRQLQKDRICVVLVAEPLGY